MEEGALDWRALATCEGLPLEWFVSEDSSNLAMGVEACATCPVTDDCFMYGYETRQQHGVWGGETPTSRSRWRSKAVRQRVVEIERRRQSQIVWATC